MVNLNFKKPDHDCSLYIENIDINQVFVILYLDDLLISSSYKNSIHEIKVKINKSF